MNRRTMVARALVLVAAGLLVLDPGSLVAQRVATGAAPVPDNVPRLLSSEQIDAIERWAAETERVGGTNPIDWRYSLPQGVRVREVAFYSNEHRAYGKVFLPEGFRHDGSWPAVVLGHGYNASVPGIEKYGARFAERGLVAMVIDYRGYNYSDPYVRLLEPDRTVDGQDDVLTHARVELVRNYMNTVKQAEDFRAAISYLQGEPGIDPERIGVWGSSQGAGVVHRVAADDARVRAVVAQALPSAGGVGASGPAGVSPGQAADLTRIARTGEGGEFFAGFSNQSWINQDSQYWGRELRPGRAIERIPETTPVLLIPAEHEELGDPSGPGGPFNTVALFRGPAKVFEIPHIGHFHIYSGPAFEASSNAAADWFLHYLR